MFFSRFGFCSFSVPIFLRPFRLMSQNAEGYGATIGCFLDDCMSSDKSGLLRGQLGPARFGQLGRASSQYIIYIYA